MFVPETYHPVLLRRKAIRLREETGNPEWIAPIEKMDRSIAKTVLWSCIRPFQLLFFEPMVGFCTRRGFDWRTDGCILVLEPLHTVCYPTGYLVPLFWRFPPRVPKQSRL